MDLSLKDLYFEMLRIRLVEEKIAELYSEQEMRCPVHLSIGQEAVAVGVCNNLNNDDQVLSAHRAHAHYLAKGGDLKSMIAELYGKETGCAMGKGGSMHLIDLKKGFFAAVPIVGSTIPIAVGVAWAFKMKSENNLVVVFLGDGATEEGAFFESLDFASLKNVPILFVCENNFYSVYSNLEVRQAHNRNILKLVQGHGIEVFSGDGNDVLNVSNTTKEAINHIKNKKAPAFITFDTYRWLEHCGPNWDDDLGYREKSELDDWMSRCPINTFEKKILDNGYVNTKDIEIMRKKILVDIDSAFQFAKNSPFPNIELLDKHIYKD